MRILSHLLKKSLIENFIFCIVCVDKLPRLYFSKKLISKPKEGENYYQCYEFNIKIGSFSGIALKIKRILNFQRWNSA